MATTVRLVGAGPGDPELVTLAAVDALDGASHVIADAGLTALVAELAPDARLTVAGDRTAHPDELIAITGADATSVVRLYVGDPWLHPGFGRESGALTSAGIAFDVVAGVAAELAHLAGAGIPLHVRHLAVIATITASDDARPNPESSHTLVLRACDLRAAATRFAEAAQPTLLAAAIPTAPDAPTVRGLLSELSQRAAPEPGLLVIGDVAGLDVSSRLGQTIGADA